MSQDTQTQGQALMAGQEVPAGRRWVYRGQGRLGTRGAPLRDGREGRAGAQGAMPLLRPGSSAWRPLPVWGEDITLSPSKNLAVSWQVTC